MWMNNEFDERGPIGVKFHGNNVEEFLSTMATVDTTREAARVFLQTMEMNPTPDAVDQLIEVFIPCLRIMCSRPWDPDGKTWRKSGVLGVLTDCRKKWERFWERYWTHGKRHDDSLFDLINYLGFTHRSREARWGEWGEPALPEADNA